VAAASASLASDLNNGSVLDSGTTVFPGDSDVLEHLGLQVSQPSRVSLQVPVWLLHVLPIRRRTV
jgi:hypothetical protein